VVITVQAAATATGFVLCIIKITSALMRTHPFHYYNGLYAKRMNTIHICEIQPELDVA